MLIASCQKDILVNIQILNTIDGSMNKKTFKVNDKQRSSAIIASAITKMSIYKEALASCHLEGIGKGLTISDLYLAELGYYREDKYKKIIKSMGVVDAK